MKMGPARTSRSRTSSTKPRASLRVALLSSPRFLPCPCTPSPSSSSSAPSSAALAAKSLARRSPPSSSSRAVMALSWKLYGTPMRASGPPAANLVFPIVAAFALSEFPWLRHDHPPANDSSPCFFFFCLFVFDLFAHRRVVDAAAHEGFVFVRQRRGAAHGPGGARRGARALPLLLDPRRFPQLRAPHAVLRTQRGSYAYCRRFCPQSQERCESLLSSRQRSRATGRLACTKARQRQWFIGLVAGSALFIALSYLLGAPLTTEGFADLLLEHLSSHCVCAKHLEAGSLTTLAPFHAAERLRAAPLLWPSRRSLWRLRLAARNLYITRTCAASL